MDDLKRKVAVLTGAASGIGEASARSLARHGVSVCIADIDLDRAKAVAESIVASGGTAFAIRCDIGFEEQIREAVGQTVERYGRLDIMHNNAANLSPEVLAADKDICTIPNDVWDSVMSVTVRGTMLGIRHAVLAMRKTGGGSIINTSSMIGIVADNIVPAYCVSKAAINMLTQWSAAKYGREGIRCNAVAPSIIRTPTLERIMPVEYMDLHASATLTPFIGTPDDIADVVTFLASDSSRYITGQVIRADGGTTAAIPIYSGARKFFAESH